MIPKQLTLKNFLSYRDATLDFRGLHVACICGANGSGKSSLLEAIAWAIWGQSRAVTEDDVIHQGEMEARVDFVFEYHQRVYRVIRTRYRNQTSALEFQIETQQGFRPLTERGMRATQHLIVQHLRLDYDTFINSAYLRQGRADEFMLKRPSERKQILADLLKLDQYDELAEQAKERSRDLKAEMAQLEQTVDSITIQLTQRDALAAEDAQMRQAIAALQHQQTADQQTLQQLRETRQQRITLEHQQQVLQQQEHHLRQDCQRLHHELATVQQQQQTVEQTLAEEGAIASGYAHLQALQAEEESYSMRFQLHQAAQHDRQILCQQLADQVSEIDRRIHSIQAQMQAFAQQQHDCLQTLEKTQTVETALEQLHHARARLTHLDQLQLKASPLLQRRQEVQQQLDRMQTRITARLEELKKQTQTLQAQTQQQSELQQSVAEVATLIEQLERRRTYQQKVREKGVERRAFLERLQERQRELECQLAAMDNKIQLLRQGYPSKNGHTAQPMQMVGSADLLPNGSVHTLDGVQDGAASLESSLDATFPPCPLCDRPLDEQHWSLVLERHLAERDDIQDQIWVIREQLTVSDREIKALRDEYRALDKELAQYAVVLEYRGRLHQQMQGAAESQQQLQVLLQEQGELERSLQEAVFAPELHDELALLDRHLSQLSYDDKNHAIARGETERWRWAEIKQAELQQARRHLAQIEQTLPQLEAELLTLQQQRADLWQSSLQQQIDALDQELQEINYDLDQHTAVRYALRQAQAWQLRYQDLLQAQQLYPHVQQRCTELLELIDDRSRSLEATQLQRQDVEQQLAILPDIESAIYAIEHSLQERRVQLDQQLAQLGRLEQRQQQLDQLQQQQEIQERQLLLLHHQQRVYHELAQAFSKNGIQALMIENVLPQLEAEANQFLGRLSNHQLHVQFITQRAGRSKRSGNRNTKLIDTLDILINDAQGTRPFETYSGGEAFRVSFSIRLALAKLLAQRSGTPLQLLIVDEGFGTQDELGCDRLIGAINAIAPDFACILTVTHMPHLKEAFQTRIEVNKSDRGSCLHLSI